MNFTPKLATVSTLRRLSRPTTGPGGRRNPTVERTTYRVVATLIKAKTEDDRDIHLVVADPRDRRRAMIVELPSTGCSGARTSFKKAAMYRARAAFVRACGEPNGSSFTEYDSRSTAVIDGVGFSTPSTASGVLHQTDSSYIR